MLQNNFDVSSGFVMILFSLLAAEGTEIQDKDCHVYSHSYRDTSMEEEKKKTFFPYINFIFLSVTAYFSYFLSFNSTTKRFHRHKKKKERKKSNFCYFRSTRSFPFCLFLYLFYFSYLLPHNECLSIVVFIDAHTKPSE